MEDLRDYWAECNQATPPEHTHAGQDGTSSWEEGEQEAAWLLAAGLPQLAGPWHAGRELWGPELAQAIRRLPPHQAEAVKRRVASLNHTIARRRARPGRQNRNTPHIRDVFSTSPTSDQPVRSVDSSASLPPNAGLEMSNPSLLQLMSLPVPGTRPPARRVASATTPTVDSTDAVSRFELFGRGNHLAREVAGDSDGVLMVGYQRIGTLQSPRTRERRSGSDPTSECGSLRVKSGSDLAEVITQPNQNLAPAGAHHFLMLPSPIRRASSQGHLSSEEAKLAVAAEWSKWASMTGPEDEAAIDARLGQTSFEGLGEEDRQRLQPLLLLEATALLDRCGAPGPKLKPPKKKRRDEPNTAVFGVSLNTLLERDRQLPGGEELSIPLVIQKILHLLEREACLREQGLLRIPGSRARSEAAANALQAEFYGPHREERALRALETLGAHELGALLKRLLRELPQPLLTTPLLDCFYHCHALADQAEKERTLRLLTLLLPHTERHVLRSLLTFLARVAEREEYNKMSLHNVAMIFAPNLFPPAWLPKTGTGDAEEHLAQQVQVAAETCRLVELMVNAGERLWSVPPGLVLQLRQQYEAERFQGGGHSLKENSKPMRRLLGRRPVPREAIVRVVENEVDFQEGIVRVHAPQFRLSEFPVQLNESTTAQDVLLRVVEEANLQPEVPGSNSSSGQHLKLRRQDGRARALSELAPNGNLSCLLASADPTTALQTHSLFERGGNIAQRQIEHSARLLAVYRENPNTQWTVVCHHRNGLPAS